MTVSPAIGFQAQPYSPARASLAPPVYVNKPHPDDFPWMIEWNPETCIRCGACVAACTFGSIEPRLMRQGQTVSVGNFPTPGGELPCCHGDPASPGFQAGLPGLQHV